MFRLIKIVNSGVNVPEIIKLPKATSFNVKIGSALTISDGNAVACSTTATPTHIAAEDAGTDKNSVFCYAVDGNMLFETVFSASPASLSVGDKVTLVTDAASGCTVKVSATTASGVATIVDLMAAKASGDKVTVKF